MSRLSRLLPITAAVVAASCGFDRGDRWERVDQAPVSICEPGERRCATAVERCEASPDGPRWVPADDCAARGLVCVPELVECRVCIPRATSCDGATVMRCDERGDAKTPESTCDGEQGLACRSGACANLCGLATEQLSNVGCEYWAVDLDNANVGVSLNAASQQFAVVISNPQPDVTARVTIEQDDSAAGSKPGSIPTAEAGKRPSDRVKGPGASGAPSPKQSGPIVIAEAAIPPLSLRVFKLGPREVDGSPPGEFDTGTHTALTRAGYRVKTSVPVVAYQFNPLENVNVFSNDASLLKPVEALSSTPGTLSPSYVVLGWPQTIASTEDPDTNFSSADPVDLRSFLTVVGTRPDTQVRVHTSTRVIGGGPIADTPEGGTIELVLQPFDVLNLETDDFNADFTGSLIEADQPVAVFSGSEASDAPFFDTLASRRCCADHLEEQLDPIRTAGKRFIAAVSSPRVAAVSQAGASLGVVEQAEYFRVIAATDAGARIETTLPGASSKITLARRGDWTNIVASRDFMLESDEPVMLGNVSASQDAAQIPRGLPGGDPSLIIVPPIEQYRASYVFLTPDKYSFDFLRIIAPPDATIVLDGRLLSEIPACAAFPGDGLDAKTRGRPDPPFVVHRCQLSFPVVDPEKDAPENLSPGVQNDGVHRLDADRKVGVLVDGFDSYVSYAYAAGTELTQIVPE